MTDIPWACPLDGLPLQEADGGLKCSANHRYDRARQGYVNLLAVQSKRSRSPGDSAEMIAARQRFLDAGCYAPLANRLVDLLPSYLSQQAIVADAGCGDGYYLQQLQQRLSAAPSMLGWDISRDAIKASCRRSRHINWAVATSVAPPLLSGSCDLLLSIFGFQHFESFAKIIKHAGLLLLVEAGPGHLLELRERIYDEVRTRQSQSVGRAREYGFEPVHSESLTFQLPALGPELLQDLLVMTPHLYRASRERLQALSQWQSVDIGADMQITLLQKHTSAV